MKYMKNHFAGILSVILAVVSLSGSSMPVVSANSAERIAKKETIVKLDEKLGAEPGKVLEELKNHEKDGYYLGTPYSGYPLTAENCMRPNGAYGGNGAMNCTGFVAYVLEKCGADLSEIDKGSLRGGKVNASNWFHWMTDNAVESYHYNTIEELLAGGKAQKGDVIYFEPVSWEEEDADCHIGFFWGDNSNDNRFWHSASIPSSGNQISQLVAKSRSTVYLFKTTHNGSLEIMKSSARSEITADNQLYSLEGAEYTVCKSGTSEAVCVIRTDKKGYGKAENLPEGSYDIKETKAPKGYVLDTKLRQITVNAGQTVTYECQDEPEKTKVEILIRKQDAETGKGQAQAGLSLAGAEFHVAFFDSFFDNQNEIGVKVPLRSWKLKSDADGVVRMDEAHLISGDPFFENNELPLGTITVWEMHAPEGYLVDTVTHCIRTGTEQNGSNKALKIWNPVEIKEKIIRGDLKLVKAADKTLKRLSDIPFQITSKATGESHVILTDFTEEELKSCIAKAYDSKFDTEEIAPLAKVEDAYYLELFHGATIAFKDMALSILPHLLTTSAKKNQVKNEIVILTATSGDTGKAALAGFADVEGTKIIVFYPKNGVSRVQELQMVTQKGDNTSVVAIHGNFDNAQSGVKAMFENKELEKELNEAGYQFSSANSINIGRLVPQVVYYVYAYAKLLQNEEIAEDEEINVVVPTGNFGNILAAYYAKNMGIPIAKLICASNENKVLYDFFQTGTYDRNREFVLTTSPSMDILISSNLERLIYKISGEDARKDTDLMTELKTKGSYAITGEMKANLADFAAGYATEEQVAKTIHDIYEDTGYVMDTHTAVAATVYKAYKEDSKDDRKTVIASTASPYKFAGSVMSAIDPKYKGQDDFKLIEELQKVSGTELPNAIKEIMNAEIRHNTECDVDQMEQTVKNILGVK